MLLGPPASANPPDMICPIILCMFGSASIEVAMFINIGLPNKLPKSKPPAGRPAATLNKKITFNLWGTSYKIFRTLEPYFYKA
jgi:hypothetical protein